MSTILEEEKIYIHSIYDEISHNKKIYIIISNKIKSAREKKIDNITIVCNRRTTVVVVVVFFSKI